MTTYFNNYRLAAKKIIEHVGKQIVIGVPLGIGKPIGLLNALYQMACEDKSINLKIITGLTLARPILHNELEKRFVEPILERVLKDYEDPLYEIARVREELPENINVIEFFLAPGKYIHNNYVQQNYISSVYTNVINDTLYYSINVLSQQITRSRTYPNQFSLSCNTDLFHEMKMDLREKEKQGKKIAIVGEINLQLPFMYGETASVSADDFTDMVDTGRYKALFAIPREEVSPRDHLIGIYTSCLIKDDSCLQIGIGKLSNAVANALIMRHKQNDVYQDLLKQLSVFEKFGEEITQVGALTPFKKGLYASTEMMSDEYLQLYKADILKKRVYDHIGLQSLLNSHQITELITPDFFDVLLKNNIINSQITFSDFQFLQKFGILKSDIKYNEGILILSSGEKIIADLSNPECKQKIINLCLGTHLLLGKIIHAGFFLGSGELYKQLFDLSDSELQMIDMTAISRTNTLHWSYELSKLQRQHARFVNSAMMVTLGGAIVSDGLKNLREISGVGGQFDFINMAHKLDNARGIINCHSTNKTHQGIQSNIIWDYPNLTIARYLRDIVITEYGIADCRSKTDAEVIKSILNITDSRFQNDLLKTAKKWGKISANYDIPEIFKQNYPENIEPVIHEFQLKGFCKPYPFGSDLTEVEMVLQQALLYLKDVTKFKLFILVVRSLFCFAKDENFANYLQRMKLNQPKTTKNWLYKKLLKLIIYNCHSRPRLSC